MRQYFNEEPNAHGNRHYDDISVEHFEEAVKSLKTKDEWRELTTTEIVVLRDQAKQLGLNKDVVDHHDRLRLLQCLFHHCENRDHWRNECGKLEKKELESPSLLTSLTGEQK